MKYEILEHKADLKIRAFGKDLKELFENVMVGMQQALRPEIKNRASIYGSEGEEEDEVLFAYQRAKIKRKIKIKSNDLSSLLVDFLSKINYLNEVNKEVYNSIRFINFSNHELEGEISGKKVENFELIIKGVTYHGLEMKKNKDDSWQATVLFDI